MRRLFIVLLTAVLAATGVRAQEVYVDNIVIVLDASGSMDETMAGSNVRKIDAAKSAIKEVVRNTPESTQVGLLVFGRQRRWEYPLGPRNDAQMFQAIDRLEASGKTPLGEFIKKGGDRLLEARKEQYGYGSYRLLIVTDGEASDQALVQRYTPDIISRGIVVDVIGVDMRQDHTLANRVHSYRRANDPDSLNRAIREVFAEIGAASDGLSGNTAFEELQGLPSQAAVAIITSLATTGNDPIGTRSDVGAAIEPLPHPRTSSPSQPRVKKQRDNNFIIVIVFILAVIFQVIRKVLTNRG